MNFYNRGLSDTFVYYLHQIQSSVKYIDNKVWTEEIILPLKIGHSLDNAPIGPRLVNWPIASSM